MARQFVLIDALPGREAEALDSLDEVEGVLAKRRLRPKIRNQDLLILVEGANADDIRKVLNESVRGLAGVSSIMVVRDSFVDDKLASQIKALEAEAADAAGAA